jgi:putative DNA primase/helicase
MIRPIITSRPGLNRQNKAHVAPTAPPPREHKDICRDDETANEYFIPQEKLAPVGAKTINLFKIATPTRIWGVLIRAGQLGMVFGWRGTGKSTIMLALAVAIAAGAKFLGFSPAKPLKVIVLDGEMDLHSMQKRLRMMAASLDVELTDRLKIMSPELFSGVMPKLTTPEGQKAIDKALGEDWDLLIIDNYSSFSSGREDAEAWGPWVPWLLHHKRAGRTVIIVHHTGKNGTQRGASNHEDAMDFVMSLRPPKIPSEDEALEFVISWTKSRHLSANRTKPFQVAFRKTDEGGYTWNKSTEIDANPVLAEVKRMHAEGKTMTEIGLFR